MAGFGENKELKFPYSVQDYAESILKVIDELKVDKVNIIAHSFGCRVATRIATLRSDKINKIVFTGAAGLKPRRSLKYFVKKASFILLKNFVDKSRLKKFYSSDYLSLSPVMKESFKKIIKEYQDEEIKKIKNKTLIIVGTKDKETPLYMAKRFNRGIKNSKLIKIKGAGHFAFLDNTDYFNEKVSSFLWG